MAIAFEPWVCACRPVNAPRVLLDEDDALIAIMRDKLDAGMGFDVRATAATKAERCSAATAASDKA